MGKWDAWGCIRRGSPCTIDYILNAYFIYKLLRVTIHIPQWLLHLVILSFILPSSCGLLIMKTSLLSTWALCFIGTSAVPQIQQRSGRFSEGLPVSPDGKGGPSSGMFK